MAAAFSTSVSPSSTYPTTENTQLSSYSGTEFQTNLENNTKLLSSPNQDGETHYTLSSASPPPIRYVIEKILFDAQERLAFRAQSYIKQEIEGFRPRDKELEVLARSRKCNYTMHYGNK